MSRDQAPEAPPGRPIDLLFIHHSVGGTLLADPGPESGASAVYQTHPEGGGLRRLLEQQGYRVHEASYHSRLGHNTDTFDWPAKFADHMDDLLACAGQDARLPDGRRNEVVLFKSCYPCNRFVGPGTEPGQAAGPELTLANAKAAYRSLLEHFARRPDVLFVCFTTPPRAPKFPPDPWWKAIARALLRKRSLAEAHAGTGRLARQMADWLKSPDGWLKDYRQPNVVAFDYFDVLTKGTSDFLAYPIGEGYDSHPGRAGQEVAARQFIPFLNRAVRRAGLAADAVQPMGVGATAPA